MANPPLVKDYFTRSAGLFDSLYSEERMNPLMRLVNKSFRSDIYERFLMTMEHFRKHNVKSVLDVGCGSGRYEVAMADAGIERAVGVDFSPNMIALAKQYTASVEGRSFDFVCSEFDDFRTDEKFDVAMAMGVLDYIEDPASFLKRLGQFANHSVLVSFPSKHFIRTPIRKVRYAIKKCPLWFYDRLQIESLGDAAGFERHEVTKLPGAGMDYVAVYYK